MVDVHIHWLHFLRDHVLLSPWKFTYRLFLLTTHKFQYWISICMFCDDVGLMVKNVWPLCLYKLILYGTELLRALGAGWGAVLAFREYFSTNLVYIFLGYFPSAASCSISFSGVMPLDRALKMSALSSFFKSFLCKRWENVAASVRHKMNAIQVVEETIFTCCCFLAFCNCLSAFFWAFWTKKIKAWWWSKEA